MSKQVQFSTVNVAQEIPSIPSTATKAQGEMNGRRFVQIEPSYAKKNDFGAGVGPGMFNSVGRVFITIGMLFASVLATIAVGIATLSLAKTGITLGVSLGITSLAFLVIGYIDPTL
jgi:hypothetical protein